MTDDLPTDDRLLAYLPIGLPIYLFTSLPLLVYLPNLNLPTYYPDDLPADDRLPPWPPTYPR